MAPEAIVGSPFKKQRASLPGFDDSMRKSLGLDLLGGGGGAGKTGKEGKGTSLGSLGESGWSAIKQEMSEDEVL